MFGYDSIDGYIPLRMLFVYTSAMLTYSLVGDRMRPIWDGRQLHIRIQRCEYSNEQLLVLVAHYVWLW